MPNEYTIPPLTKNTVEIVFKLVNNGLIAKMINQPINKYMIVESFLYFFEKNTLKTIPRKAIVHTITKSVVPNRPLKAINVIGVYVPAINRKIAEWSSILNRSFTLPSGTLWYKVDAKYKITKLEP